MCPTHPLLCGYLSVEVFSWGADKNGEEMNRAKCLWCGEQMSLVKRISKADYCSDEHRQYYYAEGQRRMLERLKASQRRLPKRPSELIVLELTA